MTFYTNATEKQANKKTNQPKNKQIKPHQINKQKPTSNAGGVLGQQIPTLYKSKSNILFRIYFPFLDKMRVS